MEQMHSIISPQYSGLWVKTVVNSYYLHGKYISIASELEIFVNVFLCHGSLDVSAVKFCTDVHGQQRMTLNGFNKPLIFPLASQWRSKKGFLQVLCSKPGQTVTDKVNDTDYSCSII